MDKVHFAWEEAPPSRWGLLSLPVFVRVCEPEGLTLIANLAPLRWGFFLAAILMADMAKAYLRARRT